MKGSGGHPASTANGAHSWHGVSGNTIGVGGAVLVELVELVVELVELVELVVELVELAEGIGSTSGGGELQANIVP